jgi:hypothetical protein
MMGSTTLKSCVEFIIIIKISEGGLLNILAPFYRDQHEFD